MAECDFTAFKWMRTFLRMFFGNNWTGTGLVQLARISRRIYFSSMYRSVCSEDTQPSSSTVAPLANVCRSRRGRTLVRFWNVEWIVDQQLTLCVGVGLCSVTWISWFVRFCDQKPSSRNSKTTGRNFHIIVMCSFGASSPAHVTITS